MTKRYDLFDWLTWLVVASGWVAVIYFLVKAIR